MYNEKADTIPRKCQACGELFTPRSYWQKFCSQEHYRAWHYALTTLGSRVVDSEDEHFKEIFQNILKESLERTPQKRETREERFNRQVRETREKEEKAREKMSPAEQLTAIKKETWREYIGREYKTEHERKIIIERNMIEKKLFISLDQYIGETNEEFESRRAVEEATR